MLGTMATSLCMTSFRNPLSACSSRGGRCNRHQSSPTCTWHMHVAQSVLSLLRPQVGYPWKARAMKGPKVTGCPKSGWIPQRAKHPTCVQARVHIPKSSFPVGFRMADVAGSARRLLQLHSGIKHGNAWMAQAHHHRRARRHGPAASASPAAWPGAGLRRV